ncbi:hypothetical protein [Cesiribacter andamanensis]|uniref:Lipoprotein n=1 Tax=Cesiribacter andamanensis AMV16 TaxID=1279009 RepID=M7NRP6_9BACT|nr:hypothetical protein [Cesiribacter andamanensis]EMR04365.1 hypothetical protein ADICEAN_00528 [Cesiribacter andamanensis AMV16]
MLRLCAHSLILWLFGLCMSCGGGSGAGDQQVQARHYKTFSLDAGHARQVLQLRWQNDTAISFVLEHQQADGACTYTLSGDAVNPYLSYDPEADTDETGEVYYIDQYFFSQGSCRLAIRVGQDTSRVQLQIANCLASPSCQLQSLGVLQREL